MTKKSTDIDALIGNDQLEITLGGKTYIVKDVPLQIFLEVSTDEGDSSKEDPRLLHKQLARLFGVDVEELETIGFRAAALAIRAVRDWLFEATGIPVEEGDLGKQPNP